MFNYICDAKNIDSCFAFLQQNTKEVGVLQ